MLHHEFQKQNSYICRTQFVIGLLHNNTHDTSNLPEKSNCLTPSNVLFPSFFPILIQFETVFLLCKICKCKHLLIEFIVLRNVEILCCLTVATIFSLSYSPPRVYPIAVSICLVTQPSSSAVIQPFIHLKKLHVLPLEL